MHKEKGEFAANSMVDAMRAYDLVLDVATRAAPVSEMLIRQLHETVCASQKYYAVMTAVGVQEQELVLGKYKSYANNPLHLATNVVHSYASPIDTPEEMRRLVEQLRSPEFEEAEPVLQAAYAHYAFVCVHPFADGNGRVARALASIYLYRSPGVPLVVFVDQKGEYSNALESADAGDPAPFIGFMADRAIDTVSMVLTQLDAALAPTVEAELERLAPVLTGRGGLQHTQIDALATRLLDVFAEAVAKQVKANPVSKPLKITTDRRGSKGPGAPDKYRMPPGADKAPRLIGEAEAPASASVVRSYSAAIAKPEASGADFIVSSATRVVLRVALREIHPTVSAALQFRAETEADREVRELVADLARRAEAALKKSGYV